jgi:hypothetical protein
MVTKRDVPERFGERPMPALWKGHWLPAFPWVSDAVCEQLRTAPFQHERAVSRFSFDGKSKSFCGSVTDFEVKALNDQLTNATPVIDAALTLQEEAVQRIGDRMKADLAVSLEAFETTNILGPYVKPVPDLPSDWNASRETFLRPTATIASVDNAKSAIGMLNKAFIQLVQNKQTISLV